ncbi:kinase-like protein [Trametes versicolor FP-101664 SS1]|uniref:kinase-like protein n=1 Tax=Trametes versicolor (strain FP-101664) TaxID=717944 RepID=UPI00046220AC|nr:kinase-like protein [Trametes versicolor FP-101664 SS1]EIW63235.1 kinase-like protein [Trametes versicolor FP-101664 SS1]
MSSVALSPRQHAVARNTVVGTPAPLARATLSPTPEKAVVVHGRRHPRIVIPDSPDMPSNPPSSDNRSTRIYTVRTSDVIMKKYQVRASIGFGSSGTVVLAENQITGSVVAIKVFHRDPDRGADWDNEVLIYGKLVAGCSPHVDLFVRVLGSGVHAGFRCIAFELCQATLFEVLQGFSGLIPLPMRHIVEIGYQIVQAVGYLHSLNIVHTDIKLDNVALRVRDTVNVRWLDPTAGFQDKKILVSAKICIIDLGSAVELQGRGPCHVRIGTRGYRAPEVAIGLPWFRKVDVFSIGCVIAELYLAHNLFSPSIEGDREYLAAVERVFGPYPLDYAEDAESKVPGTFALQNGASVQYPPPGISLAASDYADAMRRLEHARPLAALIHDRTLIDLLRRMMAPVPARRISLEDAAKHMFFDSLMEMERIERPVFMSNRNFRTEYGAPGSVTLPRFRASARESSSPWALASQRKTASRMSTTNGTTGRSSRVMSDQDKQLAQGSSLNAFGARDKTVEFAKGNTHTSGVVPTPFEERYAFAFVRHSCYGRNNCIDTARNAHL